MPKNKNHKSLLKRIRISKTGKIRHRSANHKHLRSGKGGKRLRQLRKDPYMSSPDAKRLEKLLFRRLRGRNDPRTALRRSPSPAERKAAKEAMAAAGTAVATKPSMKVAKPVGADKPAKSALASTPAPKAAAPKAAKPAAKPKK